jgi:hypothetical protein
MVSILRSLGRSVATALAATLVLTACSSPVAPLVTERPCVSILGDSVKIENDRTDGVPNDPFQVHPSTRTTQIFVNSPVYGCGDTLTATVGSTTTWRLEIWRLGSYGGKKARKVWSSPDQPASPAITPIRSQAKVNEPFYGFVGAQGGSSVSVALSLYLRPGLFVARVHDDRGRVADAPFTIHSGATARGTVFVVSSSTYQMYNTWGGSSAYRVDFIPRPYRGKVTSAKKLQQTFSTRVSERRPWKLLETLVYGDWPIVEYLESRGVNVSYATDIDIPELAKSSSWNAIIFGQHPEYVSVEARRGLSSLVTKGTNNHCLWRKRVLLESRARACWHARGTDFCRQAKSRRPV